VFNRVQRKIKCLEFKTSIIQELITVVNNQHKKTKIEEISAIFFNFFRERAEYVGVLKSLLESFPLYGIPSHGDVVSTS